MFNDIVGWVLKHLAKMTSVWNTVWTQWAWLTLSCKNLALLSLLLLCKSEVVLSYLNHPSGSFSEKIFVFFSSSCTFAQKPDMETIATAEAPLHLNNQ